MRNDPKQGRWPYTEQAGEVPFQTPNGTARFEGDRPDTNPPTWPASPRVWRNGNRTGE